MGTLGRNFWVNCVTSCACLALRLRLVRPFCDVSRLLSTIFWTPGLFFCDFRRFGVDLGIDFQRFSSSCGASNWTRSADGPTSVFAGRRSTSEGSQTLRKSRKSTNIDGTLLRPCFSNKSCETKLIFSARLVRDVPSERFFVDVCRFSV